MSTDTKPITQGARLDFRFRWRPTSRPWLEAGETITSRTVTVEGPITKDSDSIEAGEDVLVWVVASATAPAGTRALIRCRVVTSLGREDTRTRELVIVARR